MVYTILTSNKLTVKILINVNFLRRLIMSSNIQQSSIAVYDPTLPHVLFNTQRKSAADAIVARSLETAKFETSHLSPLGLGLKTRAVTRLAEGLSYLYIDKELGQRMASTIIRNLHKGRYDSALNPITFKNEILADLHAVYPDKHLGL